MDIEKIRALIGSGAFSVTDHALTEGFKDGITVADMVKAIQTGKVIENYRDRYRCLIFGRNLDGIPVHVVVDFRARGSVDIVTAYVPQRDQWISEQVRKRRTKKR